MTMRVRVGGLGDIAPITVWGQTVLRSAAQGEVSSGLVMVRDEGLSPMDFVSGSRVEVDLGPGTRNIWGGYLMKAARKAFVDPDDIDAHAGYRRLWALRLVDNNFLFARRWTLKLSDPSVLDGPVYTTTAYDDDVIHTLVTEWLDLSADGVDASSRVSRVASIYWGQPVYPWNGGMTWGDSMRAIAQLPAAVFALDPDWRLVYGDVDASDVGFIVSTSGRAPGVMSCSEKTIWSDGLQLANDFTARGFGKGASQGVVRRLVDAPSVALHGLWQDSYTAYDVWKQSTIDKAADSAVYGSPSSKRGRKDDRVRVELSTFEHGLRIADRVRFTDPAEAFDDVLPVRSVKISPVTADTAKYELVLSHEIDQWGFMDPQPPFRPIYRVPIDLGLGGTVTVPGGCDCGITDTFTRTVSGGWGTADCGIAWTMSLGAGESASVDGAAGHFTVTSSGFPALLAIPGQTALDMTVSMKLGAGTTLPAASQPAFDAVIYDAALSNWVEFTVRDDSASGHPSFVAADANGSGPPGVSLSIDPYSYTSVRVLVAGSSISLWVWQTSGAMPSTPTLSWTVAGISGVPLQNLYITPGALLGGFYTEVVIDSLDITGVTRCTAVQFDDFNRTVASGWGTATPSGEAWTLSGSGTFAASVDGTSGLLQPSAFGRAIESAALPAGAFLMTALFKFHDGADWFGGADLFFSTDTSANVEMFKGGAGTLSVVGTNSNGSAVPGFSEDVWYYLKWDFHSVDSHVRAKIWAASSPEPAWQVDFDDGVVATPPTILNADLSTGSADATLTVDSIDFDYVGRPCYYDCSGGPCVPVDPAAGVPGAYYGERTDTAVRVSGTVYQLPYAFIAGSPQVKVAGLRQRPGASNEYTEDPAAGTITFNAPVDPSDPVVVTYIANGSRP